MVVVDLMYKFRERHRVHYWIRLLAVTVAVVYLILYAHDGSAATTHTFEVIDETRTVAASGGVFCRGLNNRIYEAALVDGGGIDVHYSDDNGTTWQESRVIAPGWESAGNLRLAGCMVTTNNSTVVVFRAEGAPDTYNIYAAILYNANGNLTARTWELFKVYGGATSATRVDCGINDTDYILVVWRHSTTTIRYRLYDFRTDTWGAAATWSSLTNAVPLVAVNTTGVFHIAYRSTQVYYDSLDKSLGPITLVTSGQLVGTPNGEDFINLDTPVADRFIYAAAESGDTVTAYIQLGHHLGCTPITVTSGGGDLRADYLSVSVDRTRELYVAWYNNDDDKVYQKHEQWDAVQGAWDVALTTALKSLTPDDIGFCSGGPSVHYPKAMNYSSNVPAEGYWHPYVYKDEVGTPDDFYYEAAWEATWYWYDWSGPEPEPEGPEELMDPLWWIEFCPIALVVIVVFAIVMTLFAIWSNS